MTADPTSGSDPSDATGVATGIVDVGGAGPLGAPWTGDLASFAEAVAAAAPDTDLVLVVPAELARSADLDALAAVGRLSVCPLPTGVDRVGFCADAARRLGAAWLATNADDQRLTPEAVGRLSAVVRLGDAILLPDRDFGLPASPAPAGASRQDDRSQSATVQPIQTASTGEPDGGREQLAPIGPARGVAALFRRDSQAPIAKPRAQAEAPAHGAGPRPAVSSQDED